MRINFGEDDTLHIIPENSVECMALKYWKHEFDKHGEKVLEVHIEPLLKAPVELK